MLILLFSLPSIFSHPTNSIICSFHIFIVLGSFNPRVIGAQVVQPVLAALNASLLTVIFLETVAVRSVVDGIFLEHRF